MVYWGEKKSEEFLEENGFKVVKRKFINHKRKLKSVLKKIGFPCVMKIVSLKIAHKNQVGGVIKNINNYSVALESYSLLKKLQGFKGVMLQKQLVGKEIVLGLKRTPEFGHILVFGSGGIDVEKDKDVSFRAVPFSEKEAKKMMRFTKIYKRLNKKEKEFALEAIMDLQKLSYHYPLLSELDINPMILNFDSGFVVDSRIIWEK
jgi:acetate---CoA ligase (ADP-forming)